MNCNDWLCAENENYTRNKEKERNHENLPWIVVASLAIQFGAMCHFGFSSNAKLTHGSLKAAAGEKTVQGEGAEAAQAASVTEPVKLWPRFSTTRAESRWCGAPG